MEIGSIYSEPAPAYIGMSVMKCGRTTGLTYGIVADNDFTTIKPIPGYGAFGQKAARFKNQILIEAKNENKPFALMGDSGSLVLSEESKPRPVGLYFASTKIFSFQIGISSIQKIIYLANPIQQVLDKFNVSIYNGKHNIKKNEK